MARSVTINPVPLPWFPPATKRPGPLHAARERPTTKVKNTRRSLGSPEHRGVGIKTRSGLTQASERQKVIVAFPSTRHQLL